MKTITVTGDILEILSAALEYRLQVLNQIKAPPALINETVAALTALRG
jgi:hypothetical protein